MPSKAKKHPKTPSSVSKSDHLPSPQTPQSMVPTKGIEPNEEDVRYLLEEAAGKYPSLIGKSAFIGRVAQVDPDSKGCKIWLSEPSMVASSLTPGSIVSVSFPSLISKFPCRFPLSPFADEYGRQNQIHLDEKLANETGNYFALGTVFPTSKVAKNEVRLSSNLSITMGCPKSGTLMFVYPVKRQFITGNGKRDENPYRTKGISLSVYDCRELFLELAQSNFKLSRNSSSIDISSEQSYDYSQNGTCASPRTPLSHFRPSLSTNKLLTSPFCEDSVLNLANSNRSTIDPFDIKEMLSNESAKRLLQACTTTWLYSRWVLIGNIVSIPMLSHLCTFRVINAKEGLGDDANHNLTNGGCSDLQDERYELLDCANDAFVVKRDTKIHLCLPSKLALETPKRCDLPRNGFELMDMRPDSGWTITKLGGLSEEYAVLKDIILFSLVDTFSRFGLRATKGVLLHGPPGTGKTSLARLCARDAGVNLFTVNGPEILSSYYGESEKALHEVFDAACRATPSVVFIDELDAIAPEKKDGGEALSQGVVYTLLNLMDGIGRTEVPLIIAATNRPDLIEPALRRSGRLDREIELGVPSPKQRFDILLSCLNEMKHSLSDKQVEHLASVTHGFVGADLAQLCNEAGLVCFRRGAYSIKSYSYPHIRSTIQEEDVDHIIETKCLNNSTNIMRDYSDSASSSISCLETSQRPPSLHSNGSISNALHDSHNDNDEEQILNVTFEDVENARLRVRPSAMREVRLEVPKVRWDDIGGQKEVKRQLIEAVEWPQKHQDAFNRIGICPPTGVLMFGPPGCSKTLLARAIASEAGMNFLAVKGPELFSKWVGESEKAVRSLFAKARTNAPSIIFFDEIDGLAATRGKESDGVSVSDRVMSQLLVEMDGLHQRGSVTVIAATNRPDKIDQALLRPGRFDRLIYVGLPDKADREEIFGVHLRKVPCSSDVSIKELACLTEGITGADISFICREAAAAATEEYLNNTLEIRMQHLKYVIAQVQPSTSQSYEELSAKFQRLVHSNGQEKLGHQKCSSSSSWSLICTYVKSKAFSFFRMPEG